MNTKATLSPRMKFEVEKDSLKRAFAKIHAINPGYIDILVLIHSAAEPPTMTELSKHCKVSTAAITGLIDRLEIKKKLVIRIHSKEDRRKVGVHLTDEGEQLVLAYNNAVEKLENPTMQLVA